jgi:NAD(P)-dependent dehydrogenase (short-subunit alcohol dehydrogenase family)
LEGKVAIITGAAGGIGQASAILFAAEGAKVACVDLKAEALEATVGQIGADAIAIAADVSNAADVQTIVERTVAELGMPTVVFNNAGIQSGQSPAADRNSRGGFRPRTRRQSQGTVADDQGGGAPHGGRWRRVDHQYRINFPVHRLQHRELQRLEGGRYRIDEGGCGRAWPSQHSCQRSLPAPP